MAADPLVAAAQLFQAGRLGDAARLCEQILATRPTAAPALSLAGLIALRTGDISIALKRLALAASVEPRNANHQFNLGEALSASARFAEAIESYRRALKLDPRSAAAQSGLAFALQAQGDRAGALDAFLRAATLSRNAPDLQTNLGVALQQAGRLDDAIAAFRRAASLAPQVTEAHFNLGAALAEKGELEAAATAYQAALRLAPDHVRALNNLGLVHEKREARETALRFYAQATERAPDFAEAWYNRANMLKELGRLPEAVAAFDRALALNPDHRDAQKNRGLARLTLGDFAAGWRDYRAREAPRAAADDPDVPLPADLRGQKILIVREQGVGDELFFLRFAPLLRARGAEIATQVDPRLAAMLARSLAFKAVFRPDEEPGGYDRRVLMADLPFLLGHADAASCPRALPIPPAPASLAKMRARLEAAGPAPWIAATWRAGVPGTMRAAPPDRLGAALAPTSGTVILVQRKPEPGAMAAFTTALGRDAVDFTAVNDDLEDMLALMALADFYVSVSNTNVHLRAAAGRPSHVLVPHPPEWRWLADTPTSPWFPDTRLYRQAPSGDWTAALARLGRELINSQ